MQPQRGSNNIEIKEDFKEDFIGGGEIFDFKKVAIIISDGEIKDFHNPLGFQRDFFEIFYFFISHKDHFVNQEFHINLRFHRNAFV